MVVEDVEEEEEEVEEEDLDFFDFFDFFSAIADIIAVVNVKVCRPNGNQLRCGEYFEWRFLALSHPVTHRIITSSLFSHRRIIIQSAI